MFASHPSVSIETETTHRAAQLSLLADRVHDLPQQILVGEIFRPARIAGPLDDLAPKTLDLVSRDLPELLVQRLPRFELLAVDEQRVRAGKGLAGGVEVAEQFQAPLLQAPVLGLPAGNVVVDELRSGRVVAHYDEAGRNLDALLLPEPERFLVVPVEGFERGPQFRRDGERVERTGLAAPLLRHLLADAVPEVAKHRRVSPRNVVGDRHAGQLDDAAWRP